MNIEHLRTNTVTLVAALVAFAAAEAIAADETPSVTYRNPVLTQDNPADPHVIQFEGAYYLYATTHTRGYDVWSSDDLIRWRHRGSVFTDPRGGAWAPDVFHHRRGDGRFYLYYTVNDPQSRRIMLGKQIGVAAADSPLGPFEDQKVLVRGAIDAHLFQDDDGRLYLYYADVRDGFRILVQPMADPLTKHGEAIEVIRPTEPWETVSGEVTEGPFMLCRDGVYYLMYSGTGADSPNYAIGYATAESPRGPFTKFAGNPIVQRGEGIYAPGHHCVVTGPDGNPWMVYHQKYNDRTNFRRFIAIDPLWFDDAGIIHARVTRGTRQPGPRPPQPNPSVE